MTGPLNVSPVDSTLVAYLNGAVTGAGARRGVPADGEPQPAQFTRVVLAGGRGRHDTVLHDATVAIEAWAKTYAAAASLMSSLDAAMHNARYVTSAIRNVTAFAAPSELPVPNSPYFRLTATYEVTVRASAL